jgi:hypothetical protein
MNEKTVEDIRNGEIRSSEIILYDRQRQKSVPTKIPMF